MCTTNESICPYDLLIQRFSTLLSNLRFVLGPEWWQNQIVPVENEAYKRGGRLLVPTGTSRVIIARLPDVVGTLGLRAIISQQ